MSDDAYDKRSGTMRDYIRKQRETDPNFKLKPNAQAAAMNRKNAAHHAAAAAAEPSAPPPGAESVEGMAAGMRCECNPGARRGEVKFVGEIPQIAAGGHWVSATRVFRSGFRGRGREGKCI